MNPDLFLLKILNLEVANPLLDRFIPLFSDLDLWKPVFLAVGGLILLSRRRSGILIIAGAFLSFLLSEALSSDVLKPLLDRPRPCEVHQWVRLLSSFCPKSPSFTSTHAANSFAVTTYLSFHFPRARVPLLLVASLVGFSRIYMGVHWPSDVVAGAALGVGCAFLLHGATKSLMRSIGPCSPERSSRP